MKITDIETVPLSIPLEHDLEMAVATLTHRDLVVVRVHTDEGVVGLGEFLAAPYFSGETQSSALALVEEVFEPALVGEDPLDVGGILATMDELAEDNWFTKSAIEMALQDLRGKHYDAPLYELLGGKRRDRVEVAWHVGSAPPAQAREEAASAVERGFDTVKLKVGEASFDRDEEMVASVREAIGPDVRLHLDANQAWSTTEAIRHTRELDAHGVDILEQPVNAWDRDGLTTVAEAVDVPILADEGVFTGMDFVQCLLQGGRVLPGVKLTKAGGVTGGQKILAAAELADVPVCPLGMPGETSIAGAAMVHLASTVEALPYGTGISPHYLEDDVVEDPVEPDDGTLPVPEGPGLGVELRAEKLDAHAAD